jgi:hypothetical protein
MSSLRCFHSSSSTLCSRPLPTVTPVRLMTALRAAVAASELEESAREKWTVSVTDQEVLRTRSFVPGAGMSAAPALSAGERLRRACMWACAGL